MFEANDTILWAAVESDIIDFLHYRYVLGWFQGAQPQDAYFARCDATTMTQIDLDEGRTVMLVGFAPARAAEFLMFEVVQVGAVFADGFESGDLSAWS